MKIIASILICAVLLAGCSGGGVDETKPVDQIKQEAQAMDAAKLEAVANKYKAAIEAKKGEISKLQGKIKDIPVKELLGDEAKKLKGDVSEISSSVKALSERMNVYLSELKKKGAELNK